jgi:hypothetical protein
MRGQAGGRSEAKRRTLPVTDRELAGQGRPVFTIATVPDPHPDWATREPQRHEMHSRDWHGLESAEQAPALAGREERSRIDRAVGVVMGRTRCSVAEAIEQMLVLSRATNRTVGEVAQSIVDESARTRTRSGHPSDAAGSAYRAGTTRRGGQRE